MSVRRFSEESNYTSAPFHDDATVLASSSPNSISNVIAGVKPASLAVLNPLRPAAGARTASSRGKPASPIVNGTLPSVSKADFEVYLKDIAGEFARVKRQSLSAGRLQQQHPANEDDLFRSGDTLASGGSTILLPPLDEVPEIFRDEHFDLANPRTFDAVTQTTPLTDNPSRAVATDQLLQERLSQYLDTVELHLTREISLRSASFFSALANLQSLHSQSAQALERVTALRTELQSLDAVTAQTGLAAVRAGLKRRRLESVSRGLDRLRELGKAVDQAQQLANAGEWEGVLGLVDEVEGALEPRSDAEVDPLGIPARSPALNGASSPPSLQPHRLKALKGLPERLSRLRMQVARSLETEATTVLMNEFEDVVSAYRYTEGTPPTWDGKLRERARIKATDRLRPIVRGLLRCGWSALEGVVAAWKPALSKEIRAYVRAELPEGGEADDIFAEGPTNLSSSNRSASLARALTALSHSEYMALHRKTTARLAAAVEVAALHSSVLQSLIIEATSEGQADARAALSMELADVVHASAEVANLRFSKIIAVRTEKHATLSLREFVEVFNEAWAFVVQCETACQRMIVGLRGVLVGQAKAFLQAFHQARVSESAKQVEVEQWTPADVAPETQSIVDDIVGGAVKDPKTFLMANPSHPNGISGVNAKTLVIEDRKYYAVAAGNKALESLADYIRIVLNLPLLATDTMSRVIEYLKQFNSRTCQVVLGAGAMRSAGLKNITAKNLALASQALSIMIALVPYVREALRRHLSTKQATMLTEFDKLKRDYQEHQYEIHAKFVAIMNDRLAIHSKSLQSVDWTQTDGEAPKKYMEHLVKETSTLHKVLVRFLPTTAVDQITGQVLKDIYAKLSEEYTKIQLHDVDAKMRLLADAQYLRTEVGAFKGLSIALPGTLLEDVVRAMPTTIPAPRQPTPSPEPSPSLQEPPPAEGVSDGLTPELDRQSQETAETTAPNAASPDLSRSASGAAVKNRLAGLFGKRASTGPTSPVLETQARRSVSADSASSIERDRERERARNALLAGRLAALTGATPRGTTKSTESLVAEPIAAVQEEGPDDSGLVVVSSDAQMQAADDAAMFAEQLAPATSATDIGTTASISTERPPSADETNGRTVAQPSTMLAENLDLEPESASADGQTSSLANVSPAAIEVEARGIVEEQPAEQPPPPSKAAQVPEDGSAVLIQDKAIPLGGETHSESAPAASVDQR